MTSNHVRPEQYTQAAPIAPVQRLVVATVTTTAAARGQYQRGHHKQPSGSHRTSHRFSPFSVTIRVIVFVTISNFPTTNLENGKTEYRGAIPKKRV
jgi:hypothetical protein